jgi:hypothetical protein
MYAAHNVQEFEDGRPDHSKATTCLSCWSGHVIVARTYMTGSIHAGQQEQSPHQSHILQEVLLTDLKSHVQPT